MKKRKRLPKSSRCEVLALYNYECALCGERRRKYLQVHHMDFNHKNDELSNLMAICIYCHAYVFHPEKAIEMIEWFEEKFVRKNEIFR